MGNDPHTQKLWITVNVLRKWRYSTSFSGR